MVIGLFEVLDRIPGIRIICGWLGIMTTGDGSKALMTRRMVASARVIFIGARKGRTNSTYNPTVEIALFFCDTVFGGSVAIFS